MRSLVAALCTASAILLCTFAPQSLAAEASKAPPPNSAAEVKWNADSGEFSLRYSGGDIFVGEVKSADGGAVSLSKTVGTTPGVEQRIVLQGKGLKLSGTVRASEEAFPCESKGAAQQKFPLIRTSHGLSRNLRNNAVYERRFDWELELPGDGSARVMPTKNDADGRTFSLACSGERIELVFRPRYYQKHKNLKYFEPWNYRVAPKCVTGWCSWWAYRDGFTEEQYRGLVKVWGEKHLPDFGYTVLQIDECYRSGCGSSDALGTPKTWLNWNDRFPGGMAEYVRLAKSIGAEPGIWTGATVSDQTFVDAHPTYFVQDANGKPARGAWINYGIDATVPEVADTLIRPTYRGFKKAGFTYLKLDAIRHLLYDSARTNPQYAKSKGITPADIVRRYFEVIREEVGPDVFILSCWGVLPEVIGRADGCRLGGDGYGPLTLQQYNSWNGVVWHNDPDHCDIRPTWTPAESGNVSNVKQVVAVDKDTILRPTLASVAGAMLLLSDHSEVYANDANLEGAKRASPILSSVPGQLYDFNPTASDKIKTVDPETISHGGQESPYDAKQFGDVCQWWMNEIDRPFEHWTVLTRMNWTDKTLPAVRVSFADLGLDPAKEYVVYEFWTKKYLGVCKDGFESAASASKETRTYALREKLDRPQIVSTSRHISQGGADIVSMAWDGQSLAGRSKVVIGDRYELVIRFPAGDSVQSATIDGKPAKVTLDGEIARVDFMPAASGEVEWKVMFGK